MDFGAIVGRGDPKEGDRIENKPLNITTAAGVASAMVILAGAIPAVIKAIGAGLTDTQLVGAFGLIGAGVIALAIVVGSDSIARAYASAWVIPRTKDESEQDVPAKPAMQAVAEALKPPAPKTPKAATSAPLVVPTLGRFVFQTHGEEEVVLAIKVEDDKDEIEYLVARPGHEPTWVRGEDVTLVAAT
jgi:hypothetical protein